MAKDKNFLECYTTLKNDKKKLKLLLRKTEADEISGEVVKNIDNKDLGLMIWQDVLTNMKDETKLFDVVRDVSFKNSNFTTLCFQFSISPSGPCQAQSG